ncbi:hypothetical protein HDR58_09425 [bacterium]|nr:hypothetical protein [bacterium]
MFFLASIPNTNPALGPIEKNKQAVSVYDRRLGNVRTVITTPEKADEYIKKREEQVTAATKKGWVLTGITTGSGAIVGAYLNTLIDRNKAKKLNELVDIINPEYKTAYDQAFDAHKSRWGNTYTFNDLGIKSNLLDKEKYKNFEFELRRLFSSELNNFKKADIKTVTKKAIKTGAITGSVLAFCFGIAAPYLKANKADRKITEVFIHENK